MAKRVNFGYFIAEGGRSIRTHGLMSFAAVCMIVVCLLIMGTFALAAVNADRLLGDLESENSFLAYVEESYTAEDSAKLQKTIEALPNVDEVTFITKSEARKAYLEGKEDVELYAQLPDEVFRDRFSIRVTDIQLFQETVDRVTGLEGIANHRAETEIAEGFVMVRNVATAIATVLVALLALVSLFIIANTTRLATFTRREEIAIMKMCGSTNAFIRWPFVFEGLLLGLMGAVIAFFFQWGIYALIEYALNNHYGFQTFFTILPFRNVMWQVAQWFGGAGVIIGVGGSAFTIRKFLRV